MGFLETWYRAPGGESYARRVLLVTLALIYSLTASGRRKTSSLLQFSKSKWRVQHIRIFSLTAVDGKKNL
jgi:hypothetical protein